MQHIGRIQRQTQAYGTTPSFLKRSSQQPLCGHNVFFELFIVFSGQSTSVEKCPEKELLQIVSLDSLSWRA
jgi:hypothetical protein